MVFAASYFSEGRFSNLPTVNVSVLSADNRVSSVTPSGSAFAFTRDARKEEGPETEVFVLQMSNQDPSCGGLKSSGFDANALFRRLDGDIELLRDLLRIFSQESPLLLQKISMAIQHGSFEEVRRLSHKLKGSALQFSGSGVASLAACLEQMGEHQSLEGAARVFSNLEQAVANLEYSLQSIAQGERWSS